MPHDRPYITEAEEASPICGRCVHRPRCTRDSERVYDCEYSLTKSDQIKREEYRKDVISTYTTMTGARQMLDKINGRVLSEYEDMHKGNSWTSYELGRRRQVMDEMKIIKESLELETLTELIAYLEKIIKGEN